QFGFFKSTGFDIFKRSEVLGELSKEIHCLAVGGTHGKTTTSSILAHLLRESGKKITAFLGGISTNFGSNFISDGTEHMVVEADEFDRSFLKLHPDLLCITSMDADHLDIYQNEKNLEESFKAFASLVSNPHHRWIKDGLDVSGLSFGTVSNADVRVQNIKIENGHYVFDFYSTDQMLRNLQFGLPGAHNLMNATVAIAMALSVGCDPNAIAKALQSFKGVDRRFSIRMKEPCVLIDDYAHHPTEIDQMAQSIQEFYPSSNKTIAVFQPHLFSRTRDFCDGFAESLSQFDHTLLLDIYPARELPIPGVTSQSIQDKMRGSAEIVSKDQLLEKVVDACADVVVFMGAGDIADEVQPIVEHLKRKSYVG
ncbi:MAG: UDP-N-acetylmuramate--L-alanine ligase, partial [Flavobacteriaceae bacterium]